MKLHFSIDGEELVPADHDCDSEQRELTPIKGTDISDWDGGISFWLISSWASDCL